MDDIVGDVGVVLDGVGWGGEKSEIESRGGVVCFVVVVCCSSHWSWRQIQTYYVDTYT